jgi:hypothetical protein
VIKKLDIEIRKLKREKKEAAEKSRILFYSDLSRCIFLVPIHVSEGNFKPGG